MVFDWLKKLGGGGKFDKKRGTRDNGTDRNAIIRRIVTAAADEVKKREGGEVIVGGESGSHGNVATAVAPADPFKAQTPAKLPPFARPAGGGDAGDIPRDKIAQRAYETWVKKGRPFGTSDQDWNQAEAELRSELLYRPAAEPLPNKPR